MRGSRPGRGGARQSLLAEAESIADKLGDPYARGVTLLMDGVICHLIGEFGRSRERLEAAEKVLTRQCAGAVWELDAARQFLMEDLYYLGDLASFQRLISTGLRQATDRGSLVRRDQFPHRPGQLRLADAGRSGSRRVAKPTRPSGAGRGEASTSSTGTT